jgi:outer membrane protein assembly factor BamE (lipoprotein component of BamABCDE complex)
MKEQYVKATRQLSVMSLLLFGIGEVSAQSTTETRLEKLEQTIQLLDRRVGTLEEQLRQRSANPSVAQDKVNWRKLQRGMSEGEVEKLLGSPLRVEGGPYTTWYYGDRIAGSVTFDGRSRTVYSWNEP